jgi:hypothetical protein
MQQCYNWRSKLGAGSDMLEACMWSAVAVAVVCEKRFVKSKKIKKNKPKQESENRAGT